LANEKREKAGLVNNEESMERWEDILVRFGGWLDDMYDAEKAAGQDDL